MSDNIFQQTIGGAPGVLGTAQAVEQVADPLIGRFKSIAAASAAASLTHPELTTDAARVDWATDSCWHNLRGVIGFGVDILRRTDANRLVTQYVASVIAADELAAGLQALSFAPAHNAPPPTEPGLPAAGGVTQAAPIPVAINLNHYGPINAAADLNSPPMTVTDGATQSEGVTTLNLTESVIAPPAEAEHDAPQTFDR